MPNPVHNDDPAHRRETDWTAVLGFIGIVAMFALLGAAHGWWKI